MTWPATTVLMPTTRPSVAVTAATAVATVAAAAAAARTVAIAGRTRRVRRTYNRCINYQYSGWQKVSFSHVGLVKESLRPKFPCRDTFFKSAPFRVYGRIE